MLRWLSSIRFALWFAAVFSEALNISNTRASNELKIANFVAGFMLSSFGAFRYNSCNGEVVREAIFVESIGVISDTHGDLYSWQKARKLWGDVELVLHAGDVLGHLGQGASDHLANEMNELPVPLLIARGNCDRDEDQERLRWPLLSPYVILWWHGRTIFMAHGQIFSQVRDWARAFSPSLVVTGHTHVASLVREGPTLYLNPGSASTPRGRDPAGVAMITRESVELVTLDGFQLHVERW